MTDLESYISRVPEPERKAHLRNQWADAVINRSIVCVCGLRRVLELAYRCLYCGEWFCCNCAEVHFGKTIQQHIEQKRIERRKEFELARNEEVERKRMSDPFMPADDRYGNEIIERLQARLTAAETRIKELEKDAEILNWMEKHKWSTEGALDCLYSVSIRKWVSDRAELDKLKGKS